MGGDGRSGSRDHFHVLGLLGSEGQAVSAEAELDGIAQRRPANHLDGDSVAEAHLKQSATDIGISGDGDDLSMAPDRQLVQTARRRLTRLRLPGGAI